ncbi:MAG: SCO family protein [Gammaproteobacteria bacterium]|nr:SCO family protein [Gammaproteobacteria bacterium]
MVSSRRRPLIQRFLLFTMVLAALYGTYHWGNQHRINKSEFNVLSVLTPPVPLTGLQLTNTEGNPFLQKDLEDYWNLLLLGYTHSDETSATMLTLMTQIVNRLADTPDLHGRVRVLFISVDPERDSPDILKAYVHHYSPDFLPLTGSKNQLEQTAQLIGAKFRTLPKDALGEYRIDHSTSIALINPKGELAGLFTGRVDPASIADDLKKIASEYP